MANDYINAMLSNGVLAIIIIPTRVATTLSTIIDHINTNGLKHELTPFVICIEISDHYTTVCCIKKNLKLLVKTPMKQFISETNQNWITITSYDLQTNLSNHFASLPALTVNNYSILFNGLMNVIQTTIKKHMPLKQPLRR